MRGANEKKTDRARRLRRVSTRAELLLWNKIRARQLGRFKFIRQEPIGPYVVDFICRECRLVVEVDGGSMRQVCLTQSAMNGFGHGIIAFCVSGTMMFLEISRAFLKQY